MAQWVKPTGYNDPDSGWLYETQAYDNNVCNWAYCGGEGAAGWRPYLELTHSAMYCSKVRFYAYWNSGLITLIDIDVYYDGAWHDVFQGAFANEIWIEKAIGSTQLITAFRFRFYHSDSDVWSALGEVDFYEQSVVPTVTTQAVTDILSTTATGNGNITVTGGENATRRGFCYMVGDTGDPTTANSVAYDDGSFGTGAYTKGLTGLLPGTTYRVRAYAVNSAGTGYGTTVQFTTDKVAPTVTTQDPTDILTTSVKGNGNITSTGGEDCAERGFQYGYTQTPTWTKKVDAGGYGAGAFYLTIDGLQPNTEYWYRAFAKNTVDPFYGYGEWVQFQTSASGTVPTGTKISICSDYSGLTFKLNGAFTDDGEPYQSFFVLSTDLAQKQGLHIYKRLEDLYNYFASKESGTCKIYIKCDNEAEWNYAGEVELTGEGDIVIKHLPSENKDTSGDVDFLAKTYLIKFVFFNDFEYIGSIFEFIPIGVR